MALEALWQGLNPNNIKHLITMFLLQLIAGSDMQLQSLDTFHDCYGTGLKAENAIRDHKLSGN